MNYFFKFLVPQLMEYFQNEKDVLLEFIPKVIKDNYKNELEIKINKNHKNKL